MGSMRHDVDGVFHFESIMRTKIRRMHFDSLDTLDDIKPG